MTLCTLHHHTPLIYTEDDLVGLSNDEKKKELSLLSAKRNVQKIGNATQMNRLIKTIGSMGGIPNVLTTTAEILCAVYQYHQKTELTLNHYLDDLLADKTVSGSRKGDKAVVVILGVAFIGDLVGKIVYDVIKTTDIYRQLAGIFDHKGIQNNPALGGKTQNPNAYYLLDGDLNPFYVISIDDWGDIQWKSMNTFAEDCIILKELPFDAPDLSQVRDMSYMFKDAHRLNVSIEHWDVSHVTNMAHTFDAAYDYNQPLMGWDVSNVTNMASMFQRAFSFNQSLESWDVSNVTDMSGMFAGECDDEYPDIQHMAFNQPLEQWDVSNVTNMAEMFAYNDSFFETLEMWDVSKVKDMSGMFRGTRFNNALEKWNVSNVENMSEMFASACIVEAAFNQPIGKWDVSHVTNMSEMFNENKSFNQPLEDWDVSNVKDMSGMFKDTNYNQPLEKWNVSNVKDMSDMFKFTPYNRPLNHWNVSNVENISQMFSDYRQPLDLWDLSSVKRSYDFNGCERMPYYDIWSQKWPDLELLKDKAVHCRDDIERDKNHAEFNSKPFKYTITTDLRPNLLLDSEVVEIPVIVQHKPSEKSFGGYMDPLYDLDCDGDGDYEFKRLTGNHQCFYPKNSGKHQIWVRGDIGGLSLCSATEFPEDYDKGFYGMEHVNEQVMREAVISIDDWGDIQWPSMYRLAAHCTALKSIPKEAPDLSHTKSMNYMFYGATYFNQSIGHWDVSNIEEMRRMFSDAIYFDQPLDGWNVSNVKDMSYMFSNARHFNHPIENWNVSNVGDMQGMFEDAVQFDQPIGNWDVSHVSKMESMFRNAIRFNQPIGNWNVSNVAEMVSMFSNASAFNQPIGNWDVSHVTDMKSMFVNARSFNQPIGAWNVSHVMDMREMFRGAEAFNQPLNDWDVSNVVWMSWMFANTKAFNQPLSRWKVSNVSDMTGMFYCTRAFNQSLASWDFSKVEKSAAMMGDATAFKQSIAKWKLSDASVMEQDNESRNTACQDFAGCTCNGTIYSDDDDDD